MMIFFGQISQKVAIGPAGPAQGGGSVKIRGKAVFMAENYFF
jgi:hypothetical protein